MTRSPLFRDTLALCGVLLEVLGSRPGPLASRLAQGALSLLDHVTLALGGFGRAEHVLTADAELRMFRARLLLACELGLVGEEPFLALSEQAERVGRQLGGWRKKLERGSAEQRIARPS